MSADRLEASVGPASLSPNVLLRLRSQSLTDVIGWVSLAYLGAILFAGVAVGLLAPEQHAVQSLGSRLAPPSLGTGASGFILGSDGLGRDLLLRMLSGVPLTFAIPAAGVAVAMLIGSSVGLLAGYYGGWLDALVMRTVDMMMSLSTFLLVLVLVALLGTGVKTLVIVFGLANWVIFARITRASVLTLKEMPFVQSARMIGCSDARIMIAHLAPSLVAVTATLAVVDLARLMITEAGLSFLGFGAQPPAVTWGLLIAEGTSHLSTAWWLVTFPGLAIASSVLAVSLIGVWLRNLTDPFRPDARRSGRPPV